MSLFAVPMDARTCHFLRTVGCLENGCRKIRISSRMMMEWWGGWWWWCWWWWWWWWRDTAKGLLREETHQAYVESSLRGGGRGGPFLHGRSGIRGPARPFASQSKTQGSPLGGYLSWLVWIMFLFHVITSYWTTYISLRSRFWGHQELNQGGHIACAEGDCGLSLVGKKRPTLDTPQEGILGRFIKMHGTWNSLHLPWNIL